MPRDWSPPPSWLRVTTLEVHTAGEPLRIVTGGLPEIPGATILEKRRHAREKMDFLRTALMWEPRGHADMYGAILTEPVTPDGDAGVLFLHNEGYSTMCGHGILGLAMAGVNAGLFRGKRTEQASLNSGEGPGGHGDPRSARTGEGGRGIIERAGEGAPGLRPAGGEDGGPRSAGGEDGDLTLRLDTPAGRVTALSRREGGTVREASFLNVPSFVYALDREVNVPGLGRVRYDVAFGGAFYAFCDAGHLGVELEPGSFREIMDVGMRVKRAVMDSLPIRHPFEPELGFLYGTILVGPPKDPANHSRNVCVFAEGEVDRSPTGTGVSARAALHHARGELEAGQAFTVESILETTFTGAVEETTSFGPHRSVVPRVSGTSFVTGRNEILIDPEDPLGHGFILR